MEERREIPPEIQEKLLILQQLQAEAESIQKKIFEIEIAESELDKTIETLEYFEGLEDGVDALMNLGAGVFAYVDVKESKKMLVDVGAGVVIEREVKEVIELLKKRKEKVGKGKEQYVQLLERIYSQAQQIQKEIAEMSKSQK
ncbi:MAG: prefoldin subunit alpha [Archaeoglobus sp.]|nr:prefoldin subunit alpha [Archaeoglobus sp.]